MSDVESSERRRPRGGKPIGLGLLGCGVVGGGVLELLAQNERYLGERVGVPLSVRRVAVRDPQKARVSAWDPALGRSEDADLETLVGRGAYLTITHKVGNDGTVWANIPNVAAPPKGATVPGVPSEFPRRRYR